MSAKDDPIEVQFNGFRAGKFAGKIHAALGATPKTEEQLVRETGAKPKRVSGHLEHWHALGVYVSTPKGWIKNPRGVRFVPREWAGTGRTKR